MRKANITFDQSFRVKSGTSGDVVIEGFANKAVADRINDIIPPDAWDLDNFKKAPIILFNHDQSKPIGRALDIRAAEDGLYIKAKISKSRDAEISRIRDLIQEGILNAFSVGFNVHDEEKTDDGLNRITKAELFETSVVTVPMNQDSLFEMSTKSFSKTKTKSEAARAVLHAKGALLAERIHGRIAEMQPNRDELLSQLAEQSGLDAAEITAILAGHVSPAPAEFIDAAAALMELDAAELRELDQSDADAQADDAEPAEEPETDDAEKMPAEDDAEPEADDEQKMEPEADEQPAEDDEQKMDEPEDEPEESEKAQPADDDERKALVDVVAVVVSKERAEEPEQAQQIAAELGYAAGDVVDDDDAFMVMQQDMDEFDDGEVAQLQLADGVAAVMAKRKDDDKSKMCDEHDDDEKMESDDDQQKMDEPESDDEPESKSKGGISGGGDATMNNEGNPHLQAANQTNVLLGVLIEEMRGLGAKMDSFLDAKKIEAAEEQQQGDEPEADDDDAEAKAMAENVERFISDLEVRLKRLES